MPDSEAAHVDKDSCFVNYASVTSRSFAVSLIVEFLGTLIFTFLGTSVEDKVLGPFVNGLALTVTIYMAANISGGHINPAVTFSTLICGFYPLLHAVLYIALQCFGAMAGSGLVAALTPENIYVGMGDGGPGCFDAKSASKDITKSQVFGWEVIMTFTLISVVYACGIAKPGHGSLTPLAVGLSLVACAGAGARYTGAALNPARVIGPLAVFKCGKNMAWIYILAELLAALLACSIFAAVSGWGPLFPMQSMKNFDLTFPEAIHMFITGRPPKRLRQSDDDNIRDLQGKIGRRIGSIKNWTSRTRSRKTPSNLSNRSSIDEEHDHNGKDLAEDKLPV